MLSVKEDDTAENCFICQSHHFVTGKHTSVYGVHVDVCVCACRRMHTHSTVAISTYYQQWSCRCNSSNKCNCYKKI